MRALDGFLWQPRIGAGGIVLMGLALVLAIGALHFKTGLAYEFHVFFILPVLFVSWFAGARPGYLLALFATAIWFVADYWLAEGRALTPLVFNSLMRLSIFGFGAWSVAALHDLLRRESRLARTDGLTGLANRREFYERGRLILAQAQRQRTPLTLVFIDLDRFKEVNDSLGHESGDALLVAVANELHAHLRASDLAGRLGGDEFALLLADMDAKAATRYLDDLRARLLATMQARGWPVTFSIGVACYAQAPADFAVLVQQADALMYEVKHSGRNAIAYRQFE